MANIDPTTSIENQLERMRAGKFVRGYAPPVSLVPSTTPFKYRGMADPTKWKELICPRCNEHVWMPRSHFQRRRYCSAKCSHAAARGSHVKSVRRSEMSEFWIWCDMRRRCHDAKHSNYKNYGGRGITVDEAWKVDFWEFFNYIGPRPSPIHSVDRIDSRGGYAPGNVRWATPKEQSRNTERNLHLSHEGRVQILDDWAVETKIPRQTISARLRRGWSTEQALGFLPPPSRNKIVMPDLKSVAMLRATDLSWRILAQKFGVSETWIWTVVRPLIEEALIAKEQRDACGDRS